MKPDDRSNNLRGYTLLRHHIPLGDELVPLNDTRWALYRAPDGEHHVLAFRGTQDWEDLGHDANLVCAFGEHKYMMDAAVWSTRVMMFLAAQHLDSGHVVNGGANSLKFQVTGHSLGGAVAMGVVLLLHDIPAVAKHFHRKEASFIRYQREILDPWNATITERGAALPYELGGGHIFNPGAIPNVYAARRLHVPNGSRAFVGEVAATPLVSATIGVGLAVGTCAVSAYLYNRHKRLTAECVDKRVITHHILGDLVSCTFRLGTERSYAPKDKRSLLMAVWPGKSAKASGPHSIVNFM